MKHLFATILITCSLAACGGSKGGGDVADRAKKAADDLCACKDFDCTKPYMQELNKISMKEKDAVGKLSADKATVYKDAQTRAAECQSKLRK